MASLQHDVQVRGPQDATFRWSATEPLQFNIAVTGGVPDYIEVTDIVEYEIGITPDLGWDVEVEMLDPYSPHDPDKTNTRLFTKRGLHTDLGTLTYDGDKEQVYVTLTDDEMDSFMSDGFPDYIWSVRGYTRHGVKSAWASIRRFKGRYQASDASFTVAPLPEVSRTVTTTIAGTKNDYIRAISINNLTGHVRYPSSDTWEADVVLGPGENVFDICGLPTFGRATSIKKVRTILTTGEVGLQHTPNTFDHLGALFGVDRLTKLDETNDNYASRIQDVFIHPAESNLQGLHNAISRNLNLSYDDYALVVRPALLESWKRSDDLYSNLRMEIDTNKIYVSSPDFRVDREHHQVDPQDLSVTLDNSVVILPDLKETVTVFSPVGQEVPYNDFTFDYDGRKVTFKEGYQYQDVWVSYSRKLSTDIGPSVSLVQLQTGLTGLSYKGHPILDVSLSTGRSGLESTDGLLRNEFTMQGNDRFKHPVNGVQYGRPLRWSNLTLHHIMDTGLWDRYYNEDNHLLNTVIESYVDSFKKKSHTTWEQVILDEDIWDPVTEDAYAANLPHMLDAKFGYWTSSNVNEPTRYTTTQAFDRGYIAQHDKSLMIYIGVPTERIKSGIGRDKDLKVVIKKPRTIEQLTEPDVYRATVRWSVTGQVDDSTYLPNSPYGSLLFGL